jgi:hypothetical protein
VIFHEWKEIWQDTTQKDISFSSRLRYLFGPPGWSHDGSRLTSKQMREREPLVSCETSIVNDETPIASIPVPVLTIHD